MGSAQGGDPYESLLAHREQNKFGRANGTERSMGVNAKAQGQGSFNREDAEDAEGAE